MRILHSIHSVNPELGGPVEFVRTLASLPAQPGDQMSVACMDDPESEYVKSFPGTIHAFGPTKGGYGYSSKYVPWLQKSKDDFDAVIVHGLWQYPGFGTWLALHNVGKPYFVFAHGMLDRWFKEAYPLKHWKKSVYWRLIENRVLKDARAVLFTSRDESSASAQTFLPCDFKEIIVGLGVSKPVGDLSDQKEKFFRQYSHLRNKTIILFLSRLHEKKGCLLLLKAFAKVLSEQDDLSTKYSDLHLVMAGSGESGYEEYLRLSVLIEPKLASRVSWTGFLSGDLKWGAIEAAQALILPSHQENFGIVVAEALACSKPVLISNKVNIWQDILQAGAGLVEPDDADGTEQLLVRWLNLSETERQEMQKNAKSCFEQKFEIQKFYARLIEQLADFITPNKNGL